MSRAVTQIQARVFLVDFGKLHRQSLSFFKRLLAPRGPADIDPFLISQAIRATIRQCNVKKPQGQRLAWNEFKVFLSSQDHQALRPLVSGLDAGIDEIIRQTLDELGAEMIGDPVVRILIDEDQEIARGMGAIRVGFKQNRKLAPPVEGEYTVRLKRGRRRPAQAPAPSAPRPEPSAATAICLTWGGREVKVAAGSKVVVGRPHKDAPPGFVSLEGAGARISRIHLAIENAASGIVISRLAGANPVEVEGRSLSQGGDLRVDALPVDIALSNREMLLQLKPWRS